MNIRKAEKEDFSSIRQFYYDCTDSHADSGFYIGWEKDVYPSQQSLIEAIDNGFLYIGEQDNKIIGAMIVNWDSNDGYKAAQWTSNVQDGEYMTVHALGVLSQYRGNGYGKQLAEKSIEIAKESGRKAIRLDVLPQNLPAVKLYPSAGYKYISTMNMYYEDTGWTDFALYEYYIG